MLLVAKIIWENIAFIDFFNQIVFNSIPFAQCCIWRKLLYLRKWIFENELHYEKAKKQLHHLQGSLKKNYPN